MALNHTLIYYVARPKLQHGEIYSHCCWSHATAPHPATSQSWGLYFSEEMQRKLYEALYNPVKQHKHHEDRSYYEVLNVQPKSSNEALRAAWKQAVMRAHPDRGGSSEEFILVQRAYEVLADPVARKRYDIGRRMVPAARPETFGQANDISISGELAIPPMPFFSCALLPIETEFMQARDSYGRHYSRIVDFDATQFQEFNIRTWYNPAERRVVW